MIFSYRGNFELCMCRGTISSVHTIRYLGFTFDNNLLFAPHNDLLSRKISKNLGILFKLSNFVPHNILKSILLFYCPSLFYLLH